MRNKHIPHIEDVLFSGNYDEILEMINAVQTPERVTLKIDGSPSIIAGHDPNGDFFVSTKSALNKTPVLYKSEKEIWGNVMDSHLAEKLVTAWKGLSKRKKLFRHVFQGDFLERNFDGIYQSNLVKYKTDVTADSIIVWHTQYEWVDGVLSMVEPTNLSNTIFINSYVDSISIQWIPVEYDLEELGEYLETTKSALSSFKNGLGMLSESKGIQRALAKTVSSMINETGLLDPKGFIISVKMNLAHYTETDIDSVIMETTKAKHLKKFRDDQFTLRETDLLLRLLYDMFIKYIILKAKISRTVESSFFKTDEIHEGLVVTGKNGKQYKIVPRMEFSAKNNLLNRGKS